jgi:DNA-binding NtrC family response regulator
MQDWKVQDKYRWAIDAAGGNLEEAARQLGMNTQSLERKIKKWGLRV